MIVQSAARDGSHLVLTMEEHTATAGVLARHFGRSADFERARPGDLFVELVGEHDRGWVPIDAAVPRNPRTDLPFTVFEIGLDRTLAAGLATIDHNVLQHPYRGVLASMHIAGLFNGRFGLEEPMALAGLDPDERDHLAGFLASEQSRRDRLVEGLRGDPDTAGWVTTDALMTDYKLLQFFDRFALWLQVTHPQDRRATRFRSVPAGHTDVEILAEPLDEMMVRLDPYPFDMERLTIAVSGRSLRPVPGSVDLAAALRSAPRVQQQVVLVA